MPLFLLKKFSVVVNRCLLVNVMPKGCCYDTIKFSAEDRNIHRCCNILVWRPLLPQSLVICHPLVLFKSTRCTWTWVFESHTCASHRIIKAGRDLLEERFLPREDFLSFGMRYPRDWRQKKARREFRLLDSLLSFINPLLPALLFSLMFLFRVSPPWLLQPRLLQGFSGGANGYEGPQ